MDFSLIIYGRTHSLTHPFPGFHPDHQCSGNLVFDVVRGPSSSCRLLFPGAGVPWNVPEFYMWQFATPQYYVDITATFQDKVS